MGNIQKGRIGIVEKVQVTSLDTSMVCFCATLLFVCMKCRDNPHRAITGVPILIGTLSRATFWWYRLTHPVSCIYKVAVHYLWCLLCSTLNGLNKADATLPSGILCPGFTELAHLCCTIYFFCRAKLCYCLVACAVIVYMYMYTKYTCHIWNKKVKLMLILSAVK